MLPSMTPAAATRTLPSSKPIRFQLLAALLVFAPPEAECVPLLAPEVWEVVPETGTSLGVNVDAGVALIHDCAAASADDREGGADELIVALPLKLHVCGFLFVASYNDDIT